MLLKMMSDYSCGHDRNASRKVMRIIIIFLPARASEQGNVCNRIGVRICIIIIIARAGVIFGIYFTSCRYSGG